MAFGLNPKFILWPLASSTQRQYSDISHISYMFCDIYLTYVSKSFWINSFFLIPVSQKNKNDFISTSLTLSE